MGKRQFIPVFVVLTLLLLAVQAFAGLPEPIEIDSCGELDVEFGYYILNSSIAAFSEGTDDYCLLISADGITLDGDNHLIYVDSGQFLRGISVQANNVEMFNLNMSGFGVTADNAQVYLNASENVVIRDSTFADSSRHAVQIRFGSNYTKVYNNVFSGMSRLALRIGESSDEWGADARSVHSVEVYNNTFSNGGNMMIYGNDFYDSSFYDNLFTEHSACTDMVRISSSTNVSFLRNSFYLTGGCGYSDIEFYDVSSSTIAHSIFNDSGASTSIYLDYSSDNIINNNTFDTVNLAISIEYDSHRNVVANNTVMNSESGVYVYESNNNVVEYNDISVSGGGVGEGSSSPLVFSWDGSRYVFQADVGGTLPLDVDGTDYAHIDKDALVASGGKYLFKVSQEYNEIVYYDQLSLVLFDHAPGFSVVSPLTYDARNVVDGFVTVSDTPTHPLQSCTDAFGNDCLVALQAYDGVWSYKDSSFVNTWTMDFGDLSDAKSIKLIVRGLRIFSCRQ